MAKRNPKHHMSDDEIPVASFSDIAFLLIVWFIITTTLVQTSAFQAEFPASEETSEPQEKDTPRVTVKDERIFYKDEGQPITVDQLREKLAALKLYDLQELDPLKTVVLESFGKVRYEVYYEVLNAITKSGGYIGVVREEEEKKK